MPETIKNLLLRSWGVIVFLLLWETAPRLEWVDPIFLPSFSTVLVEVGKLVMEGSLQVNLLVSTWRAMTGLILALTVGLPVGLLLGRYLQEVADAVDPVLRVLSQINPFTLLPVFILFFGIGETAKVAVVAWVCLWPIIFYTVTASRRVEPLQLKTAASMGISQGDLLLKVILPASLPIIFTGIRIAACLTFYILVAAEMLGAGAGLGALVHNSAMNYLVPRIYAGATVIVLLGFLLNRFLRHLEGALFSWQERDAVYSQVVPAQKAVFRPGKAMISACAALVLVTLVLGGLQVQKINRDAASGAGHGALGPQGMTGEPHDIHGNRHNGHESHGEDHGEHDSHSGTPEHHQ